MPPSTPEKRSELMLRMFKSHGTSDQIVRNAARAAGVNLETAAKVASVFDEAQGRTVTETAPAVPTPRGDGTLNPHVQQRAQDFAESVNAAEERLAGDYTKASSQELETLAAAYWPAHR